MENNKSFDFQGYMSYKLRQHLLEEQIRVLTKELEVLNKAINDIELNTLKPYF